jgi:arylsulfatase A
VIQSIRFSRVFLSLAALTALTLTGCQSNRPPQAATRLPNVVIIFCDDMAYADISPFGGKTATPNLARLAKEGMRFTDFYVPQAVCSASRAALLTGCYPNRVGIFGALGPRGPTIRHSLYSRTRRLCG